MPSNDPREILRRLVERIDDGTQTWHLQYSPIMGEARACLSAAEDFDAIECDAARYRWLKSKANLELRTERTYGPPWTNVETQEKYHPFGYLAVNGTGFTGIKDMDDAIDQAMEMYP